MNVQKYTGAHILYVPEYTNTLKLICPPFKTTKVADCF